MKNLVLTFFTLSCICLTNAQNYKFGKVSKEEVQNNVYEKDTSANAVFLYKYRDTYFNHDHPDGWILVTEVHERVKILNKDGLDYATKKVNLFRSNSAKERISGIKGLTYNLEGGKLKTEKLKKTAIFKEESSDNWIEQSFTLPNAKVGSVVEWSYKVTSPFLKIDDLIIQEDIPTKHYLSKIQLLSYFNFQRIAKGGFSIVPKEYKEPRTLSISYEQNTSGALTQETRSSNITTTEFVTEYELRDVPALKEEPYVDNIDNYRYLITYELNSTQFPNSGFKQYSTTWEKVVETIGKSDDFGKQLSNTRFLKDDVEKIKSASSGEREIMINAFNHIKSKMSWNEKFGKYTRRGIQKAYKDNTGDVSEINLMLVALLKECGLKANPVLTSSRRHGIPVFPTLEGFNYVIACVEIGGQDILLDATDKLSYPNVLPQRVLNWEGTLVLDDGRFRKINLYPKKASQHNTIMSMTINDDGSLSGKQTSSYTDLAAMAYRKKVRGYSNDEYIDELINDYTFDDLVDFESKNREDLSKSVMESYSFEFDQGVDVVGNEMYFSPLFFFRLSENPFKLEDRTYPVNFTYPSSRKKIINVKIPEGYQVTSTPKPIKMSLPDGMGSFLFNISVVEGGINVMSTFKVNTAIIPAHRYAELKEFYNQRVLKEAEKVVLTKM
jgi:hypothetical protein